MIGTSTPELVFIRTCIFLLRYTSPLCLVCLAALGAARGGPVWSLTVSKFLIAYPIIDLLYAVFVYIPYRRRLKQEAKHPPLPARDERRALFYRIIENVPDPVRYLQGWLLGLDETELRRENIRDFVLWAFLDKAPGQESEEDDAELCEYIDTIEERIGQKFVPGRGRADPLRLTLDKIETRYRSVVWWLLVAIVDGAKHVWLVWHGFRYYAQPRSKALAVIPPRVQDLFAQRQSVAPGLSYWYRPHTARDRIPVVFLHGIGIGLYTYVPYLADLNSKNEEGQQIGIIAIEFLPISFRLTDAPPGKLEFLDQITAIINAHGWQEFALVTHSYGSVCATHMLRSVTLNPRISSAVLIDPVSILLHLPYVAYNFTRRQPKTANEWQLWYFASMDPGVAHCLGRHFFWKDNIAWKEDLVHVGGEKPGDGGVGETVRTASRRRKVAVCLAERDLIVDTRTVVQYLAGGDDWINPDGARPNGYSHQIVEQGGGSGRGHLTRDGIEIFWFSGLDHAQAFDSTKTRELLCDITRRYCAR